jgi:hypothetical protein
MELAELRRQLLREIERARAEAAERRQGTDAAHAAFGRFLVDVAGPLVRQTVGILRAEGLPFQAQTPAGAARIASEKAADDFCEFFLDTSVRPPRLAGRLSVAVSRHNVHVEETPIAEATALSKLTDTDLLPFLLSAVGRLAAR